MKLVSSILGQRLISPKPIPIENLFLENTMILGQKLEKSETNFK